MPDDRAPTPGRIRSFVHFRRNAIDLKNNFCIRPRFLMLALEPMRKVCLLLVLLFGVTCLAAFAQPMQLAQNPAPLTANSSAPIQIRLGNSAITLAGPWKFAPGDSPWVNGSFLWASPAFDDAAWANMDLHSAGEIDATYGNSGYLAGWAARGFPHLAGFAWYRIRVHIVSSSGPLWLKMPDHVDDAYQIFANGKFVGQFGQFTSNGVTPYRSRPLIFPLPAADAHGDILLAVRFYLEPMVLAMGTSTASGGMHQAPVLGLHASVASALAQAASRQILNAIVPIFVSFLLLIAAMGAFRLWLLDRPHWTYMWLTLAFLLISAAPVILAASTFSFAITQDTLAVLMPAVSTLSVVCWILFWRGWFELDRSRWVECIALGSAFATILIQAFFVYAHSYTHAMLTVELSDGFEVILAVMIFVVLLQGGRKDRVGALLAFVPAVLFIVGLFSIELLAWFGFRTSFFPFGIHVSIEAAATFLLVLVVGILVARRFLRSQVDQRLERQAVEQEMEQARELQQHVLIPEPVASSSFTVETAYYPARTVGGDFFQVVPYADGSLLIVVGDVSGKGIAAAMLVAVLVGAVRTRADETRDPAAILQTLNERLLGRAGGHFATCVVAHLQSNGTMSIASAGHLPPYRNGVALDLPGALPLGIAADVQYDVSKVQLQPADYLTFLTDGVLEARNAAREMLGFDQLAEISAQPAESIAQAAIAHGQDDDITVVSVRLAAPVLAATSSPVLQPSPI